MHIIQPKEVDEFISPFIGKIVSRVWQGHGSAIFLEIGDLTNAKGELTVMIEWSWRVEKETLIDFGSWSDDNQFPKCLTRLENLTLKSIQFQSRLPEIILELSENYWVCSFSTVEGDPEWALISQEKTLHSSNGVLIFE